MSDHGDAAEGGSKTPEHFVNQSWSKDAGETNIDSEIPRSLAWGLSPLSPIWSKKESRTPFVMSGQKEISIKLNQITAEKMKQFCVELESPNCDVEILRLADGWLSDSCLSALTSALIANPSFLRELHLTDVTFRHNQLSLLSEALENQHCRIRTLRFVNCIFGRSRSVRLTIAIKRNPSHLKELDLSRNNLGILTMKNLCNGLMGESCRLERLKLTSCQLSEMSCKYLSKLLMSTSCHLQELDLSGNHLKDDGIERLSVGLINPNCKLSILRLAQCELTDKSCAVLINALERRPVPLDELDLQGNDFSSEGMKMLNEFKISSGIGERLRVGRSRVNDDSRRFTEAASSFSQQDVEFKCFMLRPRHSDVRAKRGQYLQDEASKLPATESSSSSPSSSSSSSSSSSPSSPSTDDKSHLEWDSSGGNTQLEKPEVDKAPSYFTSEVFHEQGRISYRFRGLGPGVYLCKLTGLGFTMTGGGELLYKIIEWDEDILRASGKLPAGPLFKIEGATNVVSQLHLLHCEQNPATLSTGLSAAHVSDDGMSFLEPLEINDTHVVVDVSHFSGFGLVKNFFKRILNVKRPISGQVLLFQRPIWTEDTQKVNVFLVPKNIPVEEVKACQENAIYIEATSSCELIGNYTYFLQCPQSILVQPDAQMGSRFDSSFGKVYHPNFDIRLKRGTREATVEVKDKDEIPVWQYCMELIVQPPASEASTATLPTDGFGPDSGAQDLKAPMKKKLFSMRKGFIERLSEANLGSLINGLLREQVINDQEKDQLKALQNFRDAVATLIDMVLNKGERASGIMIQQLSEVDKFLYDDLSKK